MQKKPQKLQIERRSGQFVPQQENRSQNQLELQPQMPDETPQSHKKTAANLLNEKSLVKLPAPTHFSPPQEYRKYVPITTDSREFPRNGKTYRATLTGSLRWADL